MKKNNNWTAIVVWMWLTMLILMTAYVVLDYIIPFSRSIVWSENSTNSYYQSIWAIEDALFKVKNRNSLSTSVVSNTLDDNSVSQIDYSYDVVWLWTTIPQPGKWNSDIDSDYNKIGWNYPLQLEIWNDVFNTNTRFTFKVPDFDWNGSSDVLWTSTSTGIISWSIVAEDDTLNADISDFNNIFIKDNIDGTALDIKSKIWMDLTWSWKTFNSFYSSNCTAADCTLRLNVIWSLINTNNDLIPYLEYKIDTWNANFPLQYTTVTTSGKSKWFKTNLSAKVKQQTIAEWFDFTFYQ